MTHMNSLTGNLLLAMPGMGDPRFHKSVIFTCIHDSKGAMGIAVNNPIAGLAFGPLMEELGLIKEGHILPKVGRMPVLGGGPVENSRGFVIHNHDYTGKDTIIINEDMCVTGTLDGLKEIAGETPPAQMIFALGYAGWSAGQLEEELQENAWMTMPATRDIVFDTPPDQKWEKAFAMLGVNPYSLSSQTGRA